MTSDDDTEKRLRALFRTRADTVQDDHITGAGVRLHAPSPTTRPRRDLPRRLAPLAAAAAVLAVAGVSTVSALHPHHANHQVPATTHSPATTRSPAPGPGSAASVPPCPSTVTAPGSSDTVCSVGPPVRAPSTLVLHTP